MGHTAAKLLLTLIFIYQKLLSPMLPARCRYYPTCSEYARLAVRWHGAQRGCILAARRVLSCHPLGGQGIDFVPLPLYKDQFTGITPTTLPLRLPERGVYKDISSYTARLNQQLNCTDPHNS